MGWERLSGRGLEVVFSGEERLDGTARLEGREYGDIFFFLLLYVSSCQFRDES